MRIRLLRNEFGYTQEELGKKVGQTKSNISKYETGALEPGVDTLRELSEVFNVSLDYLMGNSDIRNPYSDVINADDIDPLDIYLDELKKEAVKRDIKFDTTSPSDLLDFLEFIQKTKEKKQ